MNFSIGSEISSELISLYEVDYNSKLWTLRIHEFKTLKQRIIQISIINRSERP